MKKIVVRLTLLLVIAFAVVDCYAFEAPNGTQETNRARQSRLRVVVTTDLPPIGVVKEGNVPNDQKSDPDDLQSMVRFLLYANEFDIEALIASSATFANVARKKNILDVIDRYAKVHHNLLKHDPLYPKPDYLRSVTFEGRSGTWGKNGQENIGDGKDSEASDALIAIVDKPDSRPIYICVWGDCSVVAQAIWKVKESRSETELERFLSKLRIYQIATQDGTIGWLREQFPKLFIIHSEKTYFGMFGSDDSISNLNWVNEHVRQNHGPLCDVYPHEGIGCTGVCEGDSPAFLWLVSANRGINAPENPTQESWGGQFRRQGVTNHFVDGPGANSVSKWRKDFQREFAERAGWCVATSKSDEAKPRVIVLTDVSTWETDDSESLVRLMVYADLLEIEGLVFTTGWSLGETRDDFIDLIHNAINAYEKDLPNLTKRSGQTGHLEDQSRQSIGYWPSPSYLRSRTLFGSKKRGAFHIGEGNDSPGSKLIIDMANEDDDRPLWISVWGGGNTLAQAIWRVKRDRSEEELKKFLNKLRVYTITDQDRDQKTPFSDSAHQWMRRDFEKNLFFLWDECAWKFQNGTGRKNWDQYEKHIQGHGHLGKEYPKYKYGVEGDTPAFLHLLPIGLNDPNVPTHGGWGGYFAWRKSEDMVTSCFTNFEKPEYDRCRSQQEHFYSATFNDFAARMDWARDGTGNRNPIVKIDDDLSSKILTRNPRAGEQVTLDAFGSSDPDGDHLSFKWSIATTAGTYQAHIELQGHDQPKVSLVVPADSAGKTIHVICEATDDGSPSLTGYRRVVFEPIK